MTRSFLDRDTVLALRDEAIEANATGIAIVSADAGRHVIEDVNAAFERITGYDAEQLLGETLATLSGPRTATEDAEAIRQDRADGTPIWVDLSLSPSFADGQLSQVMLTLRDATDLMRAQAALRLNRDLGIVVRTSERPADIMPDVARLMVPVFADWCVIHLLHDDGSLSATSVTHATEPAPAGATAVDVRAEGIGAVAMSSITLAHQPADPHNPVLARQLERILDRPVHAIAAVPIASDATHTFGAITWAITEDKRQFAPEDIEVAEDVGARLGYYFDMYRARENLSSALHSRETFLSQAGHELRTPVVSIRGYAQLLLRDIRRQSLSAQRLESGAPVAADRRSLHRLQPRLGDRAPVPDDGAGRNVPARILHQRPGPPAPRPRPRPFGHPVERLD
jgi:PAS domain S-box-containing protein